MPRTDDLSKTTRAGGGAVRELPGVGEQAEGHVCLEVAHRAGQVSQFDTACSFEEGLPKLPFGKLLCFCALGVCDETWEG